MTLTTEQHVDFFLQQALTQLDDKAAQAVREAMMPQLRTQIELLLHAMVLGEIDPGEMNMVLKTEIRFTVAVEFKFKEKS